MFHTLYNFEDQNEDFNIQNSMMNIDYIKNGFELNGINENYFGKGNYAIDQYNRRKNVIRKIREKDEKFRNTKNKVRLVVYKNGFILNNGPFRDSSIPENNEFLNEVERGLIPQELIKQGIDDLGILLVNRKNEIYRSPLYQSMKPSTRTINIFQNPYEYEYKSENEKNYYETDFPYYEIQEIKPKVNMNVISQTPIGTRNQRNDIFFDINREGDNEQIYMKSSGKPKEPKNSKKNEKKIVDFLEFKENYPEKNKYIAFSGVGQLIGQINTEGLYINKEIKSFVDYLSPICNISIRLFNGEIIQSQFNYTQTLRDIYLYVRRISGSNNFVLLDGFPPRPLIDYGKTIGELGLQNSLLTQRIN